MESKQYIEISKLSNWNENPRKINNKDLERLKNLIKRLGEIKPLIVSKDSGFVKDGTVIGGNMRLRAMNELGFKECWVTERKFKNKAEMIEVALADNERAGYYDKDILPDLIIPFKDEINFDDFSIDLKEPLGLDEFIDNQIEFNEKDDLIPETPKKAKTKLGDIWQLGNHRLMCGDSTKIEDVEKLMNGKKADMIFTDPPYGVDYEGKTKEKLKIKNDKDTNIFKESITGILLSLKLGGGIYVCCPAGNNFKDFLIPFDENFYQSSTIIWNKNSLVMGHGDYHYKHEPILYGWQKDGKHSFYGDRTQTTVWDVARPTASKLHPTMKPIELIIKAINNSSKSEDLLYEPFCGSGSTLIACEQTNRVCYGMELDERYVDVIVERYCNFTGSRKIKLNGKPIIWKKFKSP